MPPGSARIAPVMIAGFGLCLTCSALAAGAAPQELPEVVVSATRDAARNGDLPAAADVVGRAALRAGRGRVNLSDALGRLPGVEARNRENYAQDLQISVRGFGARSTFGVRGVRLLTDGIPATMPDGQGQAATFDLDSASRLEVLRGPFAAIHGNASGGVIQLFSESPPPAPAAALDHWSGSRDSRRTAVKLGGRWNEAGAVFNAARFETGGYREHSAARRDTSHFKLTVPVGDGDLSLIASTLRQDDTQDPLGLTREQLAADRRQAGSGALAFDTRKSIAHRQAGLTYRRDWSPRDTVHLMLYGGAREVLQFLPFAGAGATSSGGVVDLDRGFHGLGLRTVHRGPATLTVGLDYERMRERRRGYVNEAGRAGGLRRDEDDGVYSIAPYVQWERVLADRWRLLAGLRHSRVAFRVDDRFVTAANPDDSGHVRYTDTSPALGLSYAWSETLDLYAALGRGFETPTFAELAYRADGGAGPNFALRPSRGRQAEIGAKARLGDASRLNLALFGIDTRDELVAGPAQAGRATYVNAARTRRHGAELALEHALSGTQRLTFSYGWLEARFDGVPGLDGRRLPGLARHRAFGEWAWRPREEGFSAALEAQWRGRVYVDDANRNSAAGHAVAHLRGEYGRRRGPWRFEVFARIENLFDRGYVGSVIVNDGNGRYYEPAPGRQWRMGVSVGYGGS